MSGRRGYSPRLATTQMLGDLQRLLEPVGGTARLLPPSKAVGAKRVSIGLPGQGFRRATLAEARQIIKELSE